MSKQDKIAMLYAEIMDILELPMDVNSTETPGRIARMLCEIFENTNKDPMKDLLPQMSLFPAKNHNMITVEDIPFVSYCSHHHFPFMGKATILYVPDENIIGLSKIPRVVQWFCKKPQLQEYLTEEIGEFLVKILNPMALTVRMSDCTHTCMTCRGVKTSGNTTTFYDYLKEGY